MSNLKSVVRFDSMPMPRAYFTPEGYLKDRPILTSVGIFEYMDHGNVRRELRLPEDVFSPESLNSYIGKPVVLTHDAGLIDKDNVADNQIGTILTKGERSGDDVRAEIIIHDTDAMKSAGLKELSLGYNLDLDETPGVWNGQRYDAVQKNIRINHLALVREARAGEQARLNLDSRDGETILTGGKNMTKKTKKRTSRADAVLSDEEFQKAVEQYKKNRAAKADAEDDEEVVAAEATAEPEGAFSDVEKKVAEVKERRDRRDEQGDPKDTDEAMGIIAHQDEDLETLFNLIDTLLAKLNFDAAGEEEKEEVPAPEETAEVTEEEEDLEEDGFDDLEELKGHKDAEDEGLEEEEEEEEFIEDADDEFVDEEEEETLTEGDDEEEEPEDENEDGILSEAVGTAIGNNLSRKKEREDSEEEEPEDEDDDEDEIFNADCGGRKSRMDEADIDRLVSQKLRMDKLGEMVGIHGLAHKSVAYGKRAIIKKVRPGVRLDGMSDTYVDACFDMARAVIKKQAKKDTAYQKRQMYNKPARMDSANTGSDASRRNMVKRQMDHNK